MGNATPNPWVPRIVVAGFGLSALAGIYHYDGRRASVTRHEHQDASARRTGIFTKAATALGKRHRIQDEATAYVG